MPLDCRGYYNCLQTHLNTNYYGVSQPKANEIIMKEKGFAQSGTKPIEYKVNLKISGEAFALKLDTQAGGSTLPLFHFLDNDSKPWSKRCDYVIFNLRKNKLFVYCFELKSESIPADVPLQLKASIGWLRALHATISAYTNEARKINVTKFILSNAPDPSPYLEATGKYLLKDHSIRHYRYADINGMSLRDLENGNVEIIR